MMPHSVYTHVKKSKSEYRSVCDRKYLVDVLNFVTLTLIEIIQRARRWDDASRKVSLFSYFKKNNCRWNCDRCIVLIEFLMQFTLNEIMRCSLCK